MQIMPTVIFAAGEKKLLRRCQFAQAQQMFASFAGAKIVLMRKWDPKEAAK